MMVEKKNIKAVNTFSTFDLLHSEHVKMLEETKRRCDYLVIGLQVVPSIDCREKNAPSQHIADDLENEGLKYYRFRK